MSCRAPQRFRRSALALAVAAVCPAAAVAQGLISPLVPDRTASATLLSGDGRVAIVDTFPPLQYYRWTPTEGASPLLYTNQDGSVALAINFNGDVIVGLMTDPVAGTNHAFRLSQGSVQSLGSLGVFGSAPDLSLAQGVSGDGNVVVGVSTSPQYSGQAFRWTAQTGMVGLGVLSGDTASSATGVSGDGRVIIGGSGTTGPGATQRAFRWTAETGMVSLGPAPGLANSSAVAANWDGTVIAGNAFIATSRAFRWTEASGITLLALPAGWSVSAATGISADGSVIVGTLGTAPATQGFRWSQAAGTQTVEEWLQANGVSVASQVTQTASGVSYDGNTVLGQLQNGEAYVARVGAFPGMITLQDMQLSLAQNTAAPAQALSTGGTVLNGLHGRPLARRAEPGKSCAWVSGDFGRDDHGERNGSFALGGVGGCHRFGDGLQAGVSLGYSASKQDTAFGGRSEVTNTFAVVEGLMNIPSTSLWASAALLYLTGEADARRVYSVNGGDLATSTGRPDVEGSGIRLRLDWENAATLLGVSLTPYGDVSYLRTEIDGYTESGGSFPARFDARTEKATELRLGVDGTYALSSATKLFGRIEAAHRSQDTGTGTSGTVLGLFDFSFPGAAIDQDWLRLGIGADMRVGPGVLSAMLNGTTQGSAPSYWLNVSYQVQF